MTDSMYQGPHNVAADEIGGVKHPRVKIQVGEDDTARDVSLSNPLPVESPFSSLEDLLSELIEQQRITNLYLSEMLGDTFHESS